MNRMHMLLTISLLLALAPACGDHAHAPDPGHGHAHDDHGSTGERPTVAVTHWTERSELFMEYPAFVAGESGRSAIHVTALADFSPLSEGEAIVVLRGEAGDAIEFRGGASRPGIFGVDLRVDRPGVYQMSLRVDAPKLQDVHELGAVTVHAPGAHIHAQPEEGETISFLKEQQWTLEFGTVAADARAIRPSIEIPATVEARSGGDALLTAPLPGRIDPSARLPVPGTRVAAGATLARIAPRSDDLRDTAGLHSALVEAEQTHALTLQERQRAERLVEAGAIPGRRLDEAHAAMTAASARLAAARERWSRFESLSEAAEGNPQTAFALVAPFDGVIAEVRVTAGASVEAGEALLRIVDADRVHVVGAVPERLAATVGEVSAAALLIDGASSLSLGRPVAAGPLIDPRSRTAEIRFALDNRAARLRIGQAVGLRLYVGDERSGTAVPESAVVDDGGRPVVFVQIGGESFERRAVRLGDAADGYVQVIQGVKAGERVVRRGAYLLRLAAMSTQIPSHGHVH